MAALPSARVSRSSTMRAEVSMLLVESAGLFNNQICNSTDRTRVIADHHAPGQILPSLTGKRSSQNHRDEGRGWLRALGCMDQARDSDNNVVVLDRCHCNGPFGRTAWHRTSPSQSASVA